MMNKLFKSSLLVGFLLLGAGRLQAQWVTSATPIGGVYGEKYNISIEVMHMTELPGNDVISTKRLFVRYGRYHIHSVEGKTPEGMPKKVVVVAGGNKIWFTFKKDKNGIKSSNRHYADVILTMIDAEGAPTRRNPVHYKIIDKTGTTYLFSADIHADTFGQFVSMTMADGTVFSRDDLKINIIKNNQGIIQQVHSPFKSLYIEELENQDFRFRTVQMEDFPSGLDKTQGVPDLPEEKFENIYYRKLSPTLISIQVVSKDLVEDFEKSKFIFDVKGRRWRVYQPGEEE